MNKFSLHICFFILVGIAFIGCSKDVLEDIKVEDPIGEETSGGGDGSPSEHVLADVLPILGIYKGDMVAYEGGININTPSDYYLTVSYKEVGIIRVKGNGINYHEIQLINDNGVIKPHPSMTSVLGFSWNSVTKVIDFTIEKPFVFVKYKGSFAF